MDPNAALVRLRDLSKRIDGMDVNDVVIPEAEEMCQVWDGLDSWMKAGGFPPDDWATNDKTLRGLVRKLLGAMEPENRHPDYVDLVNGERLTRNEATMLIDMVENL